MAVRSCRGPWLCDPRHRSLQLRKGCNCVTFSYMEVAATARNTSPKQDEELALRLGALFLRCMGPQSGEVLRVLDESGLTFVQMKVLVELQNPADELDTVTALADELG